MGETSENRAEEINHYSQLSECIYLNKIKDSRYEHLAPWCSGNILAFGANVGGSNPPGAVLSKKDFY